MRYPLSVYASENYVINFSFLHLLQTCNKWLPLELSLQRTMVSVFFELKSGCFDGHLMCTIITRVHMKRENNDKISIR